MNEFAINLLCTVGGIIISFVFSYIAFRHREKNETKEDGKHDGVIMSDIGYIKAGVDDLKRENREISRTLGLYNERITRCEESCKQAHHRIDELKGGE